jgi:DHA2 family multidrug resistance protein
MNNNGTQTAPRWLISIAIMLATIMVILDMTIVNVALPQMMGALGATSNQITWVLTSFIVAQAVFIPLTGYFSGRFGRKHLLLVSLTGFIVASALCGQAHVLGEMVIFRVLQGMFGAFVIPLSQAIMVDIFPREERGKAMALWGIGIMLGPILGPTLGGFITQHLTWRWVFYINLPIGMFTLMLIWVLIEQTPLRQQKTDWFGAVLMMVGVGSLQIVLDRGNQENWFNSDMIITLTSMGSLLLIAFIWRAWHREDSVVNLRLLKDRNLAMASTLIATFGLGMFGTIALLPILLERLLHYPVETTGLVMAPRGIGAAIGMAVVSRVIARLDVRKILLAGITLSALASYIMTWYDLSVSPGWIVWPGFLQGFGMGLMFVPLSTVAYATIDKQHTDQASGLFNVLRTIGSSAGISILATVLSRSEQGAWNQLGGHINSFNPALHSWLQSNGMTIANPTAPILLAGQLGNQATMIGFLDSFWFVTWSFILLAPLVLFIKPQKQAAPLAAAE